MGNANLSYNSQIFRKDFPVVIAMNRQSALLLPVAARYNAAGLIAGTVLAKNSVDGLYDTYVNSGASGTGTAVCVLFESVAPEDFNSTASTGSYVGVGIFGNTVLFKASCPNIDSNAETNMGMKEVTGADGVTLLKF